MVELWVGYLGFVMVSLMVVAKGAMKAVVTETLMDDELGTYLVS